MKTLPLILPILLLLFGYSWAEQHSADGRYLDLENGVIEDTKTGLMWTQRDSYVDLGKSLNWYESDHYVKELSTGGYHDWRLPSLAELGTIYEPSKINKDIYGGKIRLDPIFAQRGPYKYWSLETEGSCCARTIAFDYGTIREHHREYSGSYGVRAVRP